MLAFGLTGEYMLQLLLDAHALISGSVALLMLHPDDFETCGLDLFVGRENAMQLVMTILDTTTYKFSKTCKSRDLHELSTSPGVDAIHSLVDTSPGSNMVIHVVVTSDPDPLVAIVSVATSLLMNFITPYGFGCAYPKMTLSRRGLTNNHAWDVSPAIVDLYASRDFTMSRSGLKLRFVPQYHICTRHDCCPLTVRSIRDSLMLYCSFYSSVQPVSVSPSVFEHWVLLNQPFPTS